MTKVVNIHASCIRLALAAAAFGAPRSAGVLLLGDSGSGKSDLALRLIGRGAELVADDRTELHVESSRPFNDGYLIAFAEVPDRNVAETWRGRYLLLPADELPPPADDQVYVHELPGMRVELADGQLVGSVEETYELPQGLAIDVRRAPPRDQETVLVPFDERTIASVDREARVIVVTPAEGLLE